MTPRLSIERVDHLDDLNREAWSSLNRAGDTPDSHRSLLCLQDAVENIQTVHAELHGESGLDAVTARHHHSVWSRESNALQILKDLAARADEIRDHAVAPQENVPDALLAHSAIPVIWRLIRNSRHEVHKQRPMAYYTRRGRRILRLLLWAVAAWMLFRGLCLISPWGGIITYYDSPGMDSIRGWSTGSVLSLDYGSGRPLPWMHRDAWSAVWQGQLQVPETAAYRFYAQCAGGMRLWIDGELLVDNWTSPGWSHGVHATRHLTAGSHQLRMDYRDRGGKAAVRVRWTGGPIPPNTEIGFPHLRKY